MSRPVLLDLFCGAGGMAVGYHRAGFDVVGVDVKPQPRYPFRFVQADALEYLAGHGRGFDAIHASPPCQRYTTASFHEGNRERHKDLVGPTRDLLESAGRPWVIENVPRAPLSPGSMMLCGLMFGLKVFRHRWFESSHLMLAPAHPSHRGKRIGVGGMCCVIGHGGGPNYRTRLRGEADNKAAWQRAMGIDWMTRDEMAQAIPPAFAEYVGRQLMTVVHGDN